MWIRGADRARQNRCEGADLPTARNGALARSWRLRRSAAHDPAKLVSRIGRLRFDRAAIRLFDGSAEVALSSGERALLKVLADHAGRTLSRQELLSLLSDDFGGRFDRSIDVRVTRLRKRLGDDAAQPRYLRTVRGQGYCFTPDD